MQTRTPSPVEPPQAQSRVDLAAARSAGARRCRAPPAGRLQAGAAGVFSAGGSPALLGRLVLGRRRLARGRTVAPPRAPRPWPRPPLPPRAASRAARRRPRASRRDWRGRGSPPRRQRRLGEPRRRRRVRSHVGAAALRRAAPPAQATSTAVSPMRSGTSTASRERTSGSSVDGRSSGMARVARERAARLGVGLCVLPRELARARPAAPPPARPRRRPPRQSPTRPARRRP